MQTNTSNVTTQNEANPQKNKPGTNYQNDLSEPDEDLLSLPASSKNKSQDKLCKSDYPGENTEENEALISLKFKQRPNDQIKHENEKVVTPGKKRKTTSLTTKFSQWRALIKWFDDQLKHPGSAENSKFLEQEKFKIVACGRGHVLFKAKKDEVKLARIRCGRNYCPFCGEAKSAHHMKVAGGIKGKLLHCPVLRYWNFTLPDEVRQRHLPKKMLTLLQGWAAEIVMEDPSVLGCATRVHFRLKKPGTLAIHINVSAPSSNPLGMISPELMNAPKKKWAAKINKEFDLDYKELVVDYSFADKIKDMLHDIYYIFRPEVEAGGFLAFSDDDKKYILSLKGLRNKRLFGNLSTGKWKETVLDLGIEIEEPPENVAPISGEKYRYECPISAKDYEDGRILDNDSRAHEVEQYDDERSYDRATCAYLKAHPEKRITPEPVIKPEPVVPAPVDVQLTFSETEKER